MNATGTIDWAAQYNEWTNKYMSRYDGLYNSENCKCCESRDENNCTTTDMCGITNCQWYDGRCKTVLTETLAADIREKIKAGNIDNMPLLAPLMIGIDNIKMIGMTHFQDVIETDDERERILELQKILHEQPVHIQMILFYTCSQVHVVDNRLINELKYITDGLVSANPIKWENVIYNVDRLIKQHVDMDRYQRTKSWLCEYMVVGTVVLLGVMGLVTVAMPQSNNTLTLSQLREDFMSLQIYTTANSYQLQTALDIFDILDNNSDDWNEYGESQFPLYRDDSQIYNHSSPKQYRRNTSQAMALIEQGEKRFVRMLRARIRAGTMRLPEYIDYGATWLLLEKICIWYHYIQEGVQKADNGGVVDSLEVPLPTDYRGHAVLMAWKESTPIPQFRDINLAPLFVERVAYAIRIVQAQNEQDKWRQKIKKRVEENNTLSNTQILAVILLAVLLSGSSRSSLAPVYMAVAPNNRIGVNRAVIPEIIPPNEQVIQNNKMDVAYALFPHDIIPRPPLQVNPIEWKCINCNRVFSNSKEIVLHETCIHKSVRCNNCKTEKPMMNLKDNKCSNCQALIMQYNKRQ